MGDSGEVQRATPSGITYSNTSYPLAVKARTKTMKIFPTNGNTGFGPSNPMIRIPLNIDGFLDTRNSYLEFDLQVVFPLDSRGPKCPNKDVVLENGAMSIFERLVLRGSDNSTIEDIQHYNVLANCLIKTQTGPNFSQTVLQAIAGTAGKATHPVPAVTDGGDYAKPFNPVGRHAAVKALTTASPGGDAFALTVGLNWPSLGPLWEYASGAADAAAASQVFPIIRSAVANEQVMCSIEAAGPEQMLAWQAGLGTRNVQSGISSELYQAWYLGDQTGHADLLAPFTGTPAKTINTKITQNLTDTTVTTLRDDLNALIPSLMQMDALNSKIKPDRCFNRQGAGIGSVQIATSRYAESTTNPTNYLTRSATAGAAGYNSRANPLSAPSFCGTNHYRCVAAMGATVTSAGQNSPANYKANAQLYASVNDQIQNETTNQQTHKRVQARITPVHSFLSASGSDGHYDATAEMAYNDWFVFQHTMRRSVGQTLMTSDGTVTPAPLISYMGTDGVNKGTATVIRWDKAKTKGCQNLKGRMVLGHARSSHLFDQTQESFDASVTAAVEKDVNQSVAQCPKYRFMVPLISGLLCNDMYLPCQFLSGGGLVLELHLATNPYVPFKIVPDQPTPLEEPMSEGFNGMTYTVSNPAYHAQVINFDEDMNERYAKLLQSGGVAWNGQTFRAHQNEFLTGGMVQKLTISERVQSLKTIFTIFRPQIYFSSNYRCLQVNSLSSYRCGITAYQWVLGSNRIPQTMVQVQTFDSNVKYPGYPFPRTDINRGADTGGFNAVDFGDHYDNENEGLVVNTAEAYIETLKAFNLTSNMNLTTSLLIEDYERECKIASKGGTDPITGAACLNWDFQANPSPWDCEFQGGMFMVALNTETFIQDSGRIQSGFNTAATAMTIALDLQRVMSASNVACSALHFCWVDQAYTITPDGMLVANV